MTETVNQKKTEKYFLIDEMTIIVAENQEQASALYQKEVDDEWAEGIDGKIDEIQDDYIIGGVQSVHGYGYDEIHLLDVLENKSLPYIVKEIELI